MADYNRADVTYEIKEFGGILEDQRGENGCQDVEEMQYLNCSHFEEMHIFERINFEEMQNL